jgi:HTH-type transcriptional regulator/antitoxin HigA
MLTRKVIKTMNLLTKTGYELALDKIDELFFAEHGTPEEERLMTLVSLVEQYEQEHHPIPAPSLWNRVLYWWESHRHWWQRT